MTYIQIFVLILIIHYLADFTLQTHEQATNKGEGKNLFNKWLFYHVGTYTLVWGVVFWTLPIMSDFQNVYGWIMFMLLVGVPHYITDFITSRIGKPFWKANDFHNGFCVVGADQVIHYICLLGVLANMVVLH